MSDNTKTLNYDPADPDKMRLPAGTTCGDCHHIRRCKAMFGHTETDTYCDWSPSRFVRAKVKCERCTVGMIGSKPIMSGEWAAAQADFDRVIENWNEQTKRFAIPHPGFARKFNYCPHCGCKVEV